MMQSVFGNFIFVIKSDALGHLARLCNMAMGNIAFCFRELSDAFRSQKMHLRNQQVMC